MTGASGAEIFWWVGLPYLALGIFVVGHIWRWRYDQFGWTRLIPLLVGLGAWRHLIRRVPLRYDPGLWSMVFPLGMYCVASEALGAALHVNWLVTVGHEGTWVAFAVWAALFAAMLASFAGLPRKRPALGQPAA